MINVKDYGAVGDGVADDTAAIQGCINNYGVIYFPKGIYCTSSMTIPSNKTLIGDGNSISELKNITNFENHYLYSGDQSNITIDSLFLNGNKDNRLANGVKAGGGSTYQFGNTNFSNLIIENNILIKNCKISGNGFNNLGSIYAKNVTIDNCKFINGRDSGMSCQAASDWKVTNCVFDDTILFPISFSLNGISATFPLIPDVYNKIGLCKDIIISNNVINVGANLDTNGNTVLGIGIELDGCKNVLISNNIIKITDKGQYGIRLIPSYEKANTFDNYNINILNNVITNQSTANKVGIEVWNNTTGITSNNIKIDGNIITNEVTSSFKSISVLNVKTTISNNTLNSQNETTQQTGIDLQIGDDPNLEFVIVENNISGNSFAGIQCPDAASTVKLFLTNNRIYNNNTNLGLGNAFDATFSNNYIPTPNYLTPKSIRGDFFYYSAPPTTGAWSVGETVKSANPTPGGYVGWICTASGTPGIWKGFGLIAA